MPLETEVRERRSLSKQELISAATKVDPDQRYYVGVCREKRKRYERAEGEKDPMQRFQMDMKKSQKDGLNEIVGTLIDMCGKSIVPDVMIVALSDWLAVRNAK